MSVPERVPPQECMPAAGRLARCFFCQQSTQADEVFEAGARGGRLRNTKVLWQGHKINTLICFPCLKRWGVPASYPEAFRVCYFCGYPGDLKESFQEMMSSPKVTTIRALVEEMKKQLRDVKSGQVHPLARLRGGVKVKVCPQCLTLFGQLAALKPDST